MDRKKNKNRYTASLFPNGVRPLPVGMGEVLLMLEKALEMPVWVLFQDEVPKNLSVLNRDVWNLIASNEKDLPEGEPVALVIDSPGGYAKHAFQIARLFNQRCGRFIAVVPRYAKSAATLLILGAYEIYMGRHAELGPLDVQFEDPEREQITSALDVVGSLARLRAFALESIDEAMLLMIGRTRKKTETVLPHTLHFVAEMMKPLFEQVDVIEFNQMSRALKVAEEYARRLLIVHHTLEEARRMARHLVEYYPEHAFFIAPEEARNMGLPIKTNTDQLDEIIDNLYHLLEEHPVNAFGHIKEFEADE